MRCSVRSIQACFTRNFSHHSRARVEHLKAIVAHDCAAAPRLGRFPWNAAVHAPAHGGPTEESAVLLIIQPLSRAAVRPFPSVPRSWFPVEPPPIPAPSRCRCRHDAEEARCIDGCSRRVRSSVRAYWQRGAALPFRRQASARASPPSGFTGNGACCPDGSVTPLRGARHGS